MSPNRELTGLVGQSPAIQALLATIRRLASVGQNSTRPPAVLIQGETGTGKGLVAALLHRVGPRAGGRFVDVNCAAIPDTLIEMELFGFERGAFTDAHRAKPGLFETAHRGTIFLDEVGLLPEALQAKLLKVIEERVVRRLGSTENQPSDAWIVSATNADLLASVRRRRFREDLYHRLAVVTLSLPPLRERSGDIPLLAQHFLARTCADYGLPALTLTPDAHARLAAYPWPGNVRELANTIERSALLCDAPRLTAKMLQIPDDSPATDERPAPMARVRAAGAGLLDEALREHIVVVLEETRGNITQSAATLGIARNTLRAYMRRFGLRTPAASESPSAPSAAPVERPLGALRLASAPRPLAVRWEGRRVTLLRASLATSQPHEVSTDATRWLELIIEKVASFHGRVEDVSPSAVEASFGVETTEDAVRRAAHAALAIQKATERQRDHEASWPPTVIAMHTSQAMVCHAGETLRIDRGSRLQIAAVLDALTGAAAAGTIAVSTPTAALLRRRFHLEREGDGPTGITHRLLRQRHSAFDAADRRSPFVGREMEIGVLSSRLSTAVRGHGQVVVLSGGAGVGKSRIVWEFTRGSLPSGVRVLEAAEADASTGPYRSVIGLLSRYFAIEPNDPLSRIEERVRALASLRPPELSPHLPALLALLGVESAERTWNALEPVERRRRIRAAIARLVVVESQIQPLVLVFEDVHWMDAESQAVLAALVEDLPSSPVLVLATCREYEAWWPQRAQVTKLAVNPLSSEIARQLLHGLLGVDPALASLKDRLIEWTDGNPFFLEESVQSLAETRVLEGERGSYRLATQVRRIEVPPTVEEILTARIDRLAFEDRSLLESAAAIGREVTRATLAAVFNVTDDLMRDRLQRLASADLLYESGAGDDRMLVFKHPLTHEVVYRGMLPDRRRGLHARILATLDADGGAETERIERLAHHAFCGEVWDKAVALSRRAAERAMQSSANEEAVAYVSQALTALGHLEVTHATRELAIDLRLSLRDALWALGRVSDIHTYLREAESLADALGERWRAGAVACYLCHYFWSIGDNARAIDAGERALQTALELTSPGLIAEAYFYLGLAYLAVGDVRRAATLLEASLATLDGVEDARAARFASRRFALHGRILVRGWAARVLAELGDFALAATRGREAIAVAEAADSPFALIAATAGMGAVHVRKGEHEKAVASLERSLALCREYHLDNWFALAAASLGYAYVGVGRSAEGLDLVTRAVEHTAKTAILAGQSLYLIYLGQAYHASGRAEEALATANTALELCRARGARGEEGWALRLLGDIAAAARPPDRAEAERRYLEALGFAEKLEMRPLAGGCHLALGRLLERAGDQTAAAGHLTSAAAIFRELDMPLVRT